MTRVHLKQLSQQTIVITGATSSIGLATAQVAVKRGAAVMLTARHEAVLRQLIEEIRKQGGRAEYHVADVADPAQVDAVAAKAVEAFGGFDTWVNDADTLIYGWDLWPGSMAGIYGRMEDVTLEDQRRLFDVTYWGVVHGTLAASRHLRHRGGAIVNVGSVSGDRAIALQGAYCAAKGAVKNATDALQMEFEGGGLPISVTLIKPGLVDTPIMEHARNAMGVLAKPTQAISDPGRAQRRDNLYEPSEDLSERSSLKGPAPRGNSLLLEAQMNPGIAVAGTGAAAAVAAAMVSTRTRIPRARRDRR